MERRREKCCHLAAMRGTESPYSFESIVPRRAVTPTRYRSLKHLFAPERGKSRISGARSRGSLHTGRSASRRYNGPPSYDEGLNFYWCRSVSVWSCFCSFRDSRETVIQLVRRFLNQHCLSFVLYGFRECSRKTTILL